ncbi:MAG: hypothetical protein J6L24_04810 [Oscillospiraceae bacterium]|nr:hypothetical protein [Oscillospiraceae bacterium]
MRKNRVFEEEIRENAHAEAVKSKICDKNCYDCRYFWGNTDFDACCNYIFAAGKRRPCDPGTGCTVKVKRKRRWVPDRERKQQKEDKRHGLETGSGGKAEAV